MIYEGRLEYHEKESMFNETVPALRIHIKEDKPKSICDIKIHLNRYGSPPAAAAGTKHTIVIASTVSCIYFFFKTSIHRYGGRYIL